MAQMSGHLTAAAPALPAPAEGTSGPLTWAAALVYGIRWAVGTRRAEQQGTARQASQWASPWPERAAGRRAALTGRANGHSR